MIDVAEVRVYHRPPAARRALLRRTLAVQLGFLVAAFAALFVWELLTTRTTDAGAWAPMAVILSVIASLQVLQTRRLVRRAMTYQLTLGPNVLRIVCQGLVPTELRRDEVTRIEEARRHLVLRYGARSRIGIPRDLAGYDEVRARLAEWRPIEPQRFSAGSRAAVLLFLVAWMATVLVPGLPLVVLVAVTAVEGAWFVWAARLVLASAATPKSKAQFCVVFGAMTLWAASRLVLTILAGRGA
jgi:hypothetical protein